MKVRQLIAHLLLQDPDEIVSIMGNENFYCQTQGPHLILDEKVLENTVMQFTSSSPVDDRELYKGLKSIAGYKPTLSMIVADELSISYAKAYDLVCKWIDEDDREINFVSEFFYEE